MNDKIRQLEEEIKALIESVPEARRKRLEGLQWRCNLIRQKYKDNPTGAMIKLSDLMFQSVGELVDALNKLPKKVNINGEVYSLFNDDV